jgi:hypothetical protein
MRHFFPRLILLKENDVEEVDVEGVIVKVVVAKVDAVEVVVVIVDFVKRVFDKEGFVVRVMIEILMEVVNVGDIDVKILLK